MNIGSSGFFPGRFSGRTVLVVGAGQAGDAGGSAVGDAAGNVVGNVVGNGRAIALTLAREGARVLCADRAAPAAQATVAAIEAEGGQARAMTADVGQPEAVQALFAAIAADAADGGALDGLVLNVGISDRRPLPEITPQSWDAILQVNLRGHVLCAQAALPVLRPGGAIVFISSVAAVMPMARNPAYESSKAALSALCRATAMEGQARDIRANVVMAGLVDTPMGRAASAARPGRTALPLPFGRQATAWEIAHAVSFLLSPQAAYINAIDLPVDGGLRHGIGRLPAA